jgi:dTDP-4-amino-4,6-dideoxygalactose transaminase
LDSPTSEDKASDLAFFGGPRLRSAPFPERGLIGTEEKAAVDVLLENAIQRSQAPGYNGPEEEAYCREFADYLGGGYADAVSSGTAAVWVALKSLKIVPFQEVIVSAVTDPGGMMPVPLLNLIPMAADTAPGSFNSGPEQIEALVSPRTAAILVAHIGGEPADMPAILEVARKHSLPVIEDCAQSHGARIASQMVGAFGDLAAFSTMFGKHHCSGGQGGFVFTRSEARYQQVRRCSDRGKPFFLPAGSTNVTASLNFNLNDLAAAIGRVQLKKLEGIVQRRKEIAATIAAGIHGLSTVSLPAYPASAEPSYWFIRLVFHPEGASCDKLTFCRALEAEGLPVTPSYRAALPHTMDWFVQRRVFGASGYPWASPAYQGDPQAQFPCPNAQAAMQACFLLQFHENWGAQEVEDAIGIFMKVDRAFHG